MEERRSEGCSFDRTVIPATYTVVYDGDCGFCQRSVDMLTAWDTDRQLQFVPSQDPSVRARFHWIPADSYNCSIQVIDRTGTTWEGAKAFEVILSALPRLRWLGRVFQLPFALAVFNRGYRWVGRNRHRLGSPACGYKTD